MPGGPRLSYEVLPIPSRGQSTSTVTHLGDDVALDVFEGPSDAKQLSRIRNPGSDSQQG